MTGADLALGMATEMARGCLPWAVAIVVALLLIGGSVGYFVAGWF
jgi:hypothetical protein